MLALVAAALLAAAPMSAPVQVAAPGLNLVNISREQGDFYNQHLAQKLGNRGVHVVTRREIEMLLSIERQKQLIGCSDAQTSCMTELANALGADGVLVGDVARLGKALQLDLRVLSARDAQVLASYSERVAADEEVLDALGRAAASLAPALSSALGRALLPPATAEVARGTPTVSGARQLFWAPGVVGVACAGAGSYFYFAARTAYDELSRRPSLTLDDAQALRVTGERSQSLAWVGWSLGVAGLLGSAAMWWLGSDPPAQLVFLPTAGGAQVGVSGRLWW